MPMTPPRPDLQKLLRLKRYEQPPEGYFEEFVTELHERQRRELMRVPVTQLFRDRLAAALHGFDLLRRPAMLYPLGAGVAALLAAVWFLAAPTKESTLVKSRGVTPARGTVSVVGVNSERTVTGPRRPAGTVAVSQQETLPEQPNGLRRTPADDFSSLVPVAHPDATSDSGPHVSPSSQVIILVR